MEIKAADRGRLVPGEARLPFRRDLWPGEPALVEPAGQGPIWPREDRLLQPAVAGVWEEEEQ